MRHKPPYAAGPAPDKAFARAREGRRRARRGADRRQPPEMAAQATRAPAPPIGWVM